MTKIILLLSLTWLYLLQTDTVSAQVLWSDDFSDGDYTLNPEWTVRNGTVEVGGPALHLFLYGDDNDIAWIGSNGNGRHQPNYYLTYKTKIFDNPESTTERDCIIVRADTSTTYTVVFYPANKKIYIWNGKTYVDSAASNNVILGSKFYVALQVVDDTIKVAVSLSEFTIPPAEWDLVYIQATVDTTVISDTLWIGGWDIKKLMFDDIVVQTPLVGIEEIYVAAPTVSVCCYPNPFNHTTVIRIQGLVISERRKFSLRIYDLGGRLVESFPLTTYHLPLSTAVSWDGRNESGEEVASGIYFCTLALGSYTNTLKLVFIR